MTRLPTLPAADDGVDPARLDGLTRVALPVGVNAVDSVNMHVLADGDSVTLVDCGVWRPDVPTAGSRLSKPVSSVVERRTRPDGVYEWYAVSA